MNAPSFDDFDAQSARTRQPLPLWCGDFKHDTMELPPEIIGAYILILMAMWQSKSCDLAADDRLLSRISRTTPTIWRRKFAPIIGPMLSKKNGRFFSEKLQESARKAEQFCRTQHARKLGKVSAKSLENHVVAPSRDFPGIYPGSSEDNPKPLTFNIKKEEEGAGAREEFFERLRQATNVTRLTPYWTGQSLADAVAKWEAMGLTEEQILAAAAESRKKNPEQPDGPKALDRWMEATAKAIVGAPVKEPKTGSTETTQLSMVERAEFWAAKINSDYFVPPSAVTPTMARIMLDRGLVTGAQLRARGIAA